MPRKVAFSGKQKRVQLYERNLRKAEKASTLDEGSFDYLQKNITLDPGIELTEEFLPNVVRNSRLSTHKLVSEEQKLYSVFEKLSEEEIEFERLKSMRPLKQLPKEALEVSTEEFHDFIDFPKRPRWSYETSKHRLETQERSYFEKWVQDVEEKYQGQQLSWFEHNLEVWRQLWRVLEISDVILIVMDIRNPLLHFPRSLYNYVTKDLKKKIVGIFNKVDLVSDFTVFAWKKYFEEEFPDLRIATFSSLPKDSSLVDDTDPRYAHRVQSKKQKKTYYQPPGVQNILSVCRDTVGESGDHIDWKSLLAQYNDEDCKNLTSIDDEINKLQQELTENQENTRCLTLGFVGHPNVGKSSLINSITRKAVASESSTPGHTKHFQTIHISEKVRLCDSPGLVFPALIPKGLQIISGMYPISQAQEPFSAIRFLAEHIPLQKILALKVPASWKASDELNEDEEYQWSAYSICEEFAEQRGYHTAKSAGPDVNRAANTILRFTAEGRILLSFKPPGFFTSTKYKDLQIQEAEVKRQTPPQEKEEPESKSNDYIRKNLLQGRNAFSELSLSDLE
ncbi:P-loop containing nucleoside triphosphate hydrolase protein [Thamnidium elegans]|nr:P-loop containing nucleoside triphosphate hydrolase protein [Thamnidium elegans]